MWAEPMYKEGKMFLSEVLLLQKATSGCLRKPGEFVSTCSRSSRGVLVIATMQGHHFALGLRSEDETKGVGLERTFLK